MTRSADAFGRVAGSGGGARLRAGRIGSGLAGSTPLGGDLQTRARNGRLRVAGAWVGFPLHPVELAGALPAPMLARIVRETLASPLRGRGTEPSFASVLRKGLGPTLYGQLYAPYAEKLWGIPGERISADQAAKRVTADTPWKVAARVLRLDRSARAGQGRVFHYPRRGFGQIVEALAAAAGEAGADIRLGTAVTEVVHSPRDVRVRTAAGDVFEAAHAFSTLPLPLLARMCIPGPPAAVLGSADRLRFRAMVLAYVVHSGGRWSPFDAHYLPGAETPITRISEPANYRASDDDPSDRSVLCAEIPCAVGDEFWAAADDDLAAVVDAALADTGLPPVRRTGIVVRRLPHVYPVYERGYADHLAGVEEFAGGLQRITTFGRQGLFAHDNTHHAMAMAYDAVAALASDGSRDEAAWAAARERFASHVVED
ncbi:MAG: FAD-dependent oxidoreductase [Actinobacteria bacterium]|nr:FAD-dependent oxidoreductase [Actinomycetota bacterium]